MNVLQRASLFTLVTLFSFVFFMLLLIAFFMEAIGPLSLIILTVLINFLLWLVGPTVLDFVYKRFYKAKFFAEDKFAQEKPELFELIKSICQKHGFNFPKMGMIEDKNPTAFTYGSTRNNARIVLTQGIFHYLDPSEVQAVVAHELGHIRNYDFIIMTVASTLIQILYEIYAIFSKSRSRSSGSGKKGDGLRAVGWISYIFYLIGSYLLLYLSRVREYFADQFSAQETGSPYDLIQGLIKIAYGIVEAEDNVRGKRLLESTRALGVIDVKNAKGAAAALVNIQDPNIVAEIISFDVVNPWARILELGSTHPLTGKRIDRLQKIAQAQGQPTVVDIKGALERLNIDRARLKKGFVKEVLIYFLPLVLPVFGLLFLGPAWFFGFLGVGMLIKTFYRLPSGEAQPATVVELMRNPYQSPMRGRIVSLEGQVVGKGVPGYVLSEDVMFQGKTGLMYLDYVSRFGFIGNWFFALKKIKEVMGQPVKAEGWFLRGIYQSVTLRKVTYEGGVIKSHPRFWSVIIAVFLIGVSFFLSGFLAI